MRPCAHGRHIGLATRDLRGHIASKDFTEKPSDDERVIEAPTKETSLFKSPRLGNSWSVLISLSSLELSSLLLTSFVLLSLLSTSLVTIAFFIANLLDTMSRG